MLMHVVRGERLYFMAERISQRPSTLNPARRMSIRLTLAAGATVATLVGSQVLGLLERPNSAEASTASNPATSASAVVQPTGAAPKLTIIRNPGATPVKARPVRNSGGQTAQNTGAITPPDPVIDQAAAPVQVQGAPAQPAPASHSSR